MEWTVRRSAIDPTLLEVWHRGNCVQELVAAFKIRKIPSAFDSLEAIQKWLLETEWKSVRASAYRLLAMRNYPSVLLKQKLVDKGYSLSVCERIIDELMQAGYLQDEEFFRNAVLRELKRGYGPRYIEQKLRAQGMNQRRVREWISDQMQLLRIRELLLKVAIGASRFARQKAIRNLQRRGFDLPLILQEIDF